MQKILIANRGEIARRVIRSAHSMGINTVAIYSDADRWALHVREADEAAYIGPSPSAESYLQMDRIIQTAKELQVDGIHPGYGFLSENATFARKVTDAGLIFIGPSPEAIEIMGSKLASKEAVKKFGIPMVPGTEEAVTDVNEAKSIAESIGFPILIKASAGGGGKGMRIVEHVGELEEQMQRAISEAESAFGDGAVFIEKYIGNPKHIEFQIMADNHGHIVHLFERECSVQRRHQKVVEEAPSPVISPEIRARMGADAVKVAQACGYSGAGTVEFLYENGNYYFLEMNTRLQVEHPVTEMITGIDLVAEQIRVARNLPLSFTQEDLSIHGHSIELRVYAEDPTDQFMPSVGELTSYVLPEGQDIRVDDGYEQGMDIPIYYDPMIAKLVVWGKDRQAAIRQLKHAIENYRIEGVATTLPFGSFVLDHPSFVDGSFTTQFVKRHYTPDKLEEKDEQMAQLAALAAAHLHEKFLQQVNYPKVNTDSDWWENRR